MGANGNKHCIPIVGVCFVNVLLGIAHPKDILNHEALALRLE
jgi:hypothetical protein